MGGVTVEKNEIRAAYGNYLIVSLSKYLSDAFGKGFSVANLKNMRQFYQIFSRFAQLTTHRVANLSCSHIRLIMRLDNEDAG
jgi:hypothetical protein